MASRAAQRASSPVETDPADTFDITKAKVVRRGPRPQFKHGVRMSLGTMRRALGKTQDELAKTMGLDQTTIARLEGQPAPRLASLRAYVEALGGEVEIVAVIDGRRFILVPGKTGVLL